MNTQGIPATTERSPMRIGMIGCGVISKQYLASFDQLPDVQLVAVADLDRARAEAAVEGRDGVRVLSVDELIADAEVDTVLNLTIPAAHADVDLRAIAAGKNVYSEKPFAVTTQEGAQVLEAAREAGVLVGSAPDTVLGTGTQTARVAIDDGEIGTPIAAVATMATPAMSAGIRSRTSTTCPAAVLCWTWARITSTRWSRCWDRWPR